MQLKGTEFKTLLRFGISGALVTVVAYALYLAAFSLTGQDFLSVLISYLLAIPLSFHLNCRFVFRRAYTLKAYALFSAMQLLAMLLNYGILRNLNLYCPRPVSALISYGLVPFIIFALSRLVIFRK